MATAEQQLLSSMSPQMARLLDEQMAGQQAAQQAPEGYGGMAAAASQGSAQLGNNLRSMFGLNAQPGVNEQQAMRAQQMQQQQAQKQQQVAGAMQGAQGANRIEKLRDTASRLRATGTYDNMILAEQYDSKADEMQLDQDKLNVDRGKLAATAAGGGSATDGHLMKDDQGNFYQTFNYKDKLGQPSVKYVPIGGAPDYTDETRLVPVSKSGETVGLTANEIVKAEVTAKTEIKSREQFQEWKGGVLDDYSTAVSQKNTLDRMIELTEELAASGDLQGGIPARAQELIYAMTGKRPNNLGELQMLFSLDSLSRLKPLFGGNISDGEREELRAAFPNILTGGKVNLEKLSVLKRATDTAYATANKRINMTYEEYMDELSGTKAKPAEPKKTLIWTPEGWKAQ
jgi:adenylate kinase family enzyme